MPSERCWGDGASSGAENISSRSRAVGTMPVPPSEPPSEPLAILPRRELEFLSAQRSDPSGPLLPFAHIHPQVNPGRASLAQWCSHHLQT